MDFGATSHMTSNQGKFFHLFNLCSPRNIIVGNCSSIPITAYGNFKLSSPYPPLSLKHVLLVPHIIKNLVSVWQFTKDHFVSVKLDHFGFCVKDLHTGTPIMRCNNTGDPYPIPSSGQQVFKPSTFLAVTSSLLHARLSATPALLSLANYVVEI